MGKRIVPKEFLGAFKRGHRQASKEFIDEELALKLLREAERGCEESRKALAWLSKFNNEFHKGVVHGAARETALHNTDELRRDCDRRNYARRNDLYTRVDLVQPYSLEYEPTVNRLNNLKGRQAAKEEWFEHEKMNRRKK